MMKNNILIVLTLILFTLGCTKSQTERSEENAEIPEKLIVSQVMGDPAKYIDKQITVEGMVTHVCRHGGKRLHITTSGSDEKLRVRIGDGMSPFERELEGSTVYVTGKLTEERFDQDYLEKLKNNRQAEEHSETDEGDKSIAPEGTVSQAYIDELEQKIESSEKGYVSEYWLTAEKVVKE